MPSVLSTFLLHQLTDLGSTGHFRTGRGYFVLTVNIWKYTFSLPGDFFTALLFTILPELLSFLY